MSVDGVEVPPAGWRSRKARELLRILASRRGRAVAREQLGDMLWPDDGDAGRVGHRLSVALSTLRRVLDPHRLVPVDYHIIAAPGSLALDVAHVELDVEEFFAEAAHGFRLVEQGETAHARAALALADRRYQGDFLADEPYEDWSAPTRTRRAGSTCASGGYWRHWPAVRARPTRRCSTSAGCWSSSLTTRACTVI